MHQKQHAAGFTVCLPEDMRGLAKYQLHITILPQKPIPNVKYEAHYDLCYIWGTQVMDWNKPEKCRFVYDIYHPVATIKVYSQCTCQFGKWPSLGQEINKFLYYTVTLVKGLNFWKLTSYCSIKPLWSDMGGNCAGSYLADPTSPIPSHCASIVATGTLTLKLLVWFGGSLTVTVA